VLRHFESKQTKIDKFSFPFHRNFEKGTYFFLFCNMFSFVVPVLRLLNVSVRLVQYGKAILSRKRKCLRRENKQQFMLSELITAIQIELKVWSLE